MALSQSPLRTEYDFCLPRGLVDAHGNVHRNGRMRLATALDEVTPMRDPRVRENPAYLTLLILSRVVTRLGEIVEVSPATIEALFTADLAYLQDFYRKINTGDMNPEIMTCPNCHQTFQRQEGEAALPFASSPATR